MDSLDELLRHPAIWRAKESSSAVSALPTGFPALDERLPGGGWPANGLIELLVEQGGTCEFALLRPALAAMHRRHASAWLGLVQPPHEPYAPALAAGGIDLDRLLVIRGNSLWSIEQALRSGSCRCALGWTMETPQIHATCLRRLQLIATEQGALCILVRPAVAAGAPSSACLRLALQPRASRLEVRILKCRGQAGDLHLDWQALHGGGAVEVRYGG